MATAKDTPAYARVSAQAVRAATGRGWDEWLQALDGAGAAAWDHSRIVDHLRAEHPEVASGWWRQSITAAYEKARGRRVEGQTADAGFQVGVRRTVDAPAGAVWALLTGRPELWLGDGVAVEWVKGARYKAGGGQGARGEVRVVRPGTRLRMTWQPAGWNAPATLQLTLSTSASGRTTIGAHLEKLPDAETREAMRDHWRAVLERIAASLE